MTAVRLVLAVAGAVLLAAGTAQAQRCSVPLPPGAGVPATSINPVVVRVLGATLYPFPASDGRVHVAYAAQVTNLAAGAATIEAIVPVDAQRGFQPTGRNRVRDVDGAEITGKVRVFGRPPSEGRDVAVLPPGTSGITFFDVTYASMAEVPELLGHRVRVRMPDGAALDTLTDPVRVSCDAPVVLRAPLAGAGWWNGNGCCETVNAHRSATLPVNGDLRPPEQFAIDFMRLQGDGTCCTGPVRDLKSWPYYGAPLLAVADGTVVVAEDTMGDQVPGEVVGITATNAPGNHVILDIGGGRWVLYAHIRPHTVAVKAGQVVRAGARIGELGNSGSSTAPHLHFQVMDRPSALNAVGLPFVFAQQRLQGTVQESAARAETESEAGRALRVDPGGAGARDNQMPVEGGVFQFPAE